MSQRRWVIWTVGVLARRCSVHRFSLASPVWKRQNGYMSPQRRLDCCRWCNSPSTQACRCRRECCSIGWAHAVHGRRAALMSVGQFIFAFADDLPTALLARILLGSGDALTFD